MVSFWKIALAVALFPAVPCEAQTWRDWGETEIRGLVEVERGSVTEVTVGGDGELHVYATFDGWLNMLFIGTDCTGQGVAQQCKKLGFNALFEVDDRSRALMLERDLIFSFVADMADGEDLVVHREVELSGGAPEANIRAQLGRFIGTCEQVSEQIWPADGGKATTKAR